MKKQSSLPSSEFIVCSGATCNCTGNPTLFAALQITTHTKYYANAVDKLIATIEDTQFVEGIAPFKTCKYKKGYDKSCVYQPLGFWKVEDNAHFPSIGTRDILTESGTLQCVLGGTISIHDHGQVVTVEEDMDKAEEPIQQAEATTVWVESTEEVNEAAASQALTYVSNVNTLQLVNLDLLYWGEMSEENPRALRLLLGDEFLFRATTPIGEDQHYISWSVTELCADETTKEKAQTGQTIHLETTPETTSYQAHPTTHRAFSWEPSQMGLYLISAARTPKDQVTKTYYSGFYYAIEVVDTLSFTSLTINQPPKLIWVVGDSVVITLHSTVKVPPTQLKRLRFVVRGTKGCQSHQTAMIFTATGAHPFQQKGCCLQAVFPSVNANTYQVEVLEDHRPIQGIALVSFQVHDNAILSISPAVE
ncbi:DUF4280 domain-containing protein, partial [Myroides sp. DW712]|uniref:DUF4280 domain-containing protein n=1 Tax=Myroides sp. DW712 TaxID=3389800 RepID=UPI003978345B